MGNMTMKEAAKYLQVEPHVLRYWENELMLEIKRNAQGHRYYDDRDIRMFEQVKTMKEQGLTLKDIRNAIIRAKREKGETGKETEEDKKATETELQPVHIRIDEDKDSMLERMQKTVGEEEKVVDFKQAQLQTVMNRVIRTALQENRDVITTSIKEEVTADVMRQFDTVMREKEEREEARYRRLDEVLREIRQANAEVAATKTKRGIWKKRR